MKRLCVIVIVLAAATVGAQQDSGEMVEWPYVGAEQSHTKYSPLAGIDSSNVDRLEIAWQWDPNEMPMPEYGARPGQLRGNAADDRRHAVLPHHVLPRRRARRRDRRREVGVRPARVRAGAGAGPAPAGSSTRGLAFRRDGDDLHLFLNSRVRLFAIDAATGQLITSFGRQRQRPSHAGPRPRGAGRRLRPDLAAGRLRGHRDRRQPGAGPRAAPLRHAGLGAGVRRPHRRAALDLLHRAAVERRVRRRHLGRPVVALHGPRQRLGP